MMKILTSSIKIERKESSTKRFRKDLGNVQAMKDSLKRFSLIHPIVVSLLEPPEPPYEWLLIAGERRLTAATFLGLEFDDWKYIEVTEKKDLDDVSRKEIEFEENIMRRDISWEEQCLAVKQLDDLKRKIHGTKEKGSLSDDGWTQKDTAKSIGASVGTVCQDIQLAKDLETIPGMRRKVSNMPKAVARKFIEREKQTTKMKLQIATQKIKLTSNLILGKCEEEIKNLADNSIDCLITDPPWGVEDIQAVVSGALCKGSSIKESDLGHKEMLEVYNVLIPELYRVMSPGAHFYMFFAADWYWKIRSMFEGCGFTADPVPLIWSKGRGTMIANPYHYIPSYEFIMYGYKKPQQRTLVKPCLNCLTSYPPDAPVKRVHPLQKPIDLIEMFIANSTIVGEIILDPFSGSGVVLKASGKLGRKSIGFEANEKNFLLSQAWLMEK